MPSDAVAALDLSGLALTPLEIALRLLCAMFIGAVIGTEREFTHRPAGMRTHMLVALGACTVMITSQALFYQYRVYGATPDPARLSAQVITGVGFLGAGTIMKEGPTIKGLTTAASVWAVACLGVAAGGGYYAVAISATVCIMVTLVLFEWLQRKLMRDRYESYAFSVGCTNVAVALGQVNALAARSDVRVSGFQIQERKPGKYEIGFKVDFNGRHASDHLQQFLTDLSGDESIDSVQSERSRA